MSHYCVFIKNMNSIKFALTVKHLQSQMIAKFKNGSNIKADKAN